jgi:hypothetical protein
MSLATAFNLSNQPAMWEKLFAAGIQLGEQQRQQQLKGH